MWILRMDYKTAALLVSCLASMILASDGSQQCIAYGNNLTQATPTSTYHSRRIFANISGPLTCAGNATSWDICYYMSTTDHGSTETYFGVYRPASANSTMYTLVQGSSFTAPVDGTAITMAYECSNFSIPRPFTVYPGDILAACVKDPDSGRLGVVATVPGASVSWKNVFGGCTALPGGPMDLSGSTYTIVNDVTLHVRLDVNECAVNNGGCQQMCNDSTPGYSCNCYSGYMLAANGLNCTTTPISSTVMTSHIQASSNTTSAALLSAILNTELPSVSSFVTPSPSYTSAPQVTTISIAKQEYTDQNPVPATVAGVVVSIFFVIGILLTVVAAILLRQRCAGGRTKRSQDSFGIHNRAYNDSEIETEDLQPNPIYVAEEPGQKQLYQVPRSAELTHTTADDKMQPPEPNNEAHSYSHLHDEMHTYSHLHDEKHSYSHIQQQTDNDKLSYSQLQQGSDDEKLSYPHCANSLNNKDHYQVPGPTYSAVVKKTADPTCIDAQPPPTVEHDENPYYMPASHEVELYVQLENQKILKVQRHEIEATADMLGSGQFGGVQVAMWNSPKGRREIAIKTLNPSSTKPEDKVKFLQEAAIMAQFRHPNVIQLYGIVTDGEPVMLVLELAGNKDLSTHLATMRPSSTSGNSFTSELPKILLAYSKQVALGMQYLSSKSFVHRDLAARNVLVTKDCICKIADFGLSRDLAEGNYYMSHGGLVPVKWTAPEAVCFMKYSTASDVWSYGCLLYEIWSIGCKPFEGLTNNEALQKVNSGYRLPPPPGCPLLVYQIMIQCWNSDAHLRPTFKDVHTCLSLHEDIVLSIPNEALLTHPQAGFLGAPLKSGQSMYLELQKSYN